MSKEKAETLHMIRTRQWQIADAAERRFEISVDKDNFRLGAEWADANPYGDPGFYRQMQNRVKRLTEALEYLEKNAWHLDISSGVEYIHKALNDSDKEAHE